MPSGDSPRIPWRLIFSTALGLLLLAIGLIVLRSPKPAAPPRDIAPQDIAPRGVSPQTMPPPVPAPVSSQPAAVSTTDPAPTPVPSGDASVPTATAPPTPSPAAPAAVVGTTHAAFTADGRLLLISADGKLEFCDPANGQRRAVGVSVGRVDAVGLSPDGRMLVTADAAGKITLIETAGYSVANSAATGVVGARGAAIGADGRTIAVAGAAGVVVWDLVDRHAKKKLGNEPSAGVAFSADGKTLAVATAAGVSLWETTFWQKQATLPGGGAVVLRYWPARAAFVAADAEGTVRVYDVATRQIQSTFAAGPLTDFAAGPDGRTIVTCGSTGVTAWDSNTHAARHLP